MPDKRADTENVIGLNQRREDLIEERIVPSGTLLGGKLLSSSEQGLVREIRVAFCESCRKHLDLGELWLCDCGRKSCESCIREYEGRRLCTLCLRAELPVRKTDLMILEAIQAGIRSKTEIARLSRTTQAETTAILRRMFDEEFLTSRGISIFATPLLTNKALAALCIYSEVYQDADLAQFRVSLAEAGVKKDERKDRINL